MQRLCQVCDTDFEAQRSTRKYCSAKCRQRARRGSKAEVHEPESDGSTGLVDAVTKKLANADRTDTVDGQAALVLARQATATGATGVSALIKEMRQVLAAALEGATQTRPTTEVSELDNARKRREQKARQAARRA